ncbi:MAG: AMP-binding protein [Xanthobacteraceae bacterium]|nr:AMP-binding protein [Xanthobacteraceae bacterium]
MMYVHSLGRAARYYPQRPATVGSEGKHSTFRELHDRVVAVAAGLNRHGFRAGDRLAMLLPNEPEYLQLIYACSLLGVIAVPVNARSSTAEIDRLLGDATPRGLVRHSSLPTPTVQLSWELVLDKEPLEAPGTSCPDPIYDPDAILALIYTSGTTGRPKGVVVTHANMQTDIDNLNYWMPYHEAGVHLHAAPVFHILDFPFIFAAPAFGACQITIPKFSAARFCETVARQHVSQTILVPTMINVLTQFPDLKAFDMTSLETVAYGGSPISPALIRRTREVLPHVKLVQVYGLSETGLLSGLQDHEHTEDRLTSCGRPCPGVDLRVVDESGKELGPGQRGELVARGANVMHGYWQNPKETALVFRDGLFRTGDVGYRDANGYFYILDRMKDMIVTGGENVYSGEVEAVIYEHPAVLEAAVFGIPDPQWGELVAACIVRKPGTSLSTDDLVAYCRRFLAKYKIPRHIQFSETELPKGGSGKILKSVLREPFWVGQKRAVS